MSWGSLFLLVAVVLGAFGAHGLKQVLSSEAKEIYQTAVFYHFVHGLGLLVVGSLALLKPDEPFVGYAGWALIAGILLFSGSLYLLSITGVKGLGFITPFGGLAFIAGWLCLAFAAR